MPTELVNHPAHYNCGEVECITAIESALGPAGFAAFCKGQVLKYLWRSDHKGNRRKDLLKAEWYLHRIIERTEGEGE